MPDDPAVGRIITFYSFKGGVGRTMALANVAFLTALSNRRVLIIDWDLEAPGVAYYFRGLLEPEQIQRVSCTPGVLDLCRNWSQHPARSAAELGARVAEFREGEPFRACTNSLLPDELQHGDRRLDFIGAGARVRDGDDAISYEQALNDFSWSDFFNKARGGGLLKALRDWAKSNYDLVFIDSRTGLADAAGICTMQLPDVVALCFILNLQNIDGVAGVAGAIKKHRGERIKLRAVPMRVARQDTAADADARARAMSELAQIGKMSASAVRDDFEQLAVPAAENIPLNESLAPLMAVKPVYDVLTINYCRLAAALCDMDVAPPEIERSFFDRVQARLKARLATVEYLANLKLAEPSRRHAELTGLLETTFESVLAGRDPSADYVQALVELVLMQTEAVRIDSVDLFVHTLDLLRQLARTQPELWKPWQVQVLERVIGIMSFLSMREAQLLCLEELDSLLAPSKAAVDLLARMSYRRTAARILISSDADQAVMQAVGDIRSFIKELQPLVTSPEDRRSMLEAEIDAFIISGDIAVKRKETTEALRHFEQGLSVLDDPRVREFRAEVMRFAGTIHRRLAELWAGLNDRDRAADHAIQSVSAANAAAAPLQASFLKLAHIVLSSTSPRRTVVDFCLSALKHDSNRPHFRVGSFFARSSKEAEQFLETAVLMLQVMVEDRTSDTHAAVALVAELCADVLKTLHRRLGSTGGGLSGSIQRPIESIRVLLEGADVDLSDYPVLYGLVWDEHLNHQAARLRARKP